MICAIIFTDIDANSLLNLLCFVIFGLIYSFVCFVEDDIHAREEGIVTVVPALPTFLIFVVMFYMVKPVSLVLILPVILVFAWYQSVVQSISQLISGQLSLYSLCILSVLLLK